MKESHRIPRALWIVAVLALVVTLTAACGGCGGGVPATGTSATTPATSPAGGADTSTTGAATTEAPTASTTASTATSASTTTDSVAAEATTTTQSSTTTTAKVTTTTAPAPPTTAGGAKGAVVLTLKNGAKSKTYTMAELKALPSVSGYWGAHKGELPYTNARYKGASLLTLLADVGGLPSGHSLQINTSDNFPCTYDADRLAAVKSGTYEVWNKTTGDEGTAAVTLIIAYEMNGAPLDPSIGPLRLVPATSSDAFVTEGKYSPYLVVSVEVQ